MWLMLLKHKKLIAVFVASLVGVIALAGSMAYMSSLFETIYYGLTGNKIVSSEDVESGNTNTYQGPYYDALHEAICQLDMSKIPDDADLGLTNTDFSIPGWNLKSYLQAYKLFAEICARDEINPPGEVQITPADLFGMMINESGGQCYSNFSSYLVWEGASDDTYWGPFEQNKIWSEIGRNAAGEGAAVVYISWEENADLPLDQRAFYGQPGALKSGQGIVLNAETVAHLAEESTNAFKSSTATAKDIESKIKIGTLSGGSQYAESRPNSKFFPDAAYTAAFNLRLSLYGYDRYTLYKADYGSGHAIDKFAELCSQSGMAGNYENAAKALAIMLNGGQWGYTIINSSVEASGGEVRAYQVMADSQAINFLGITTVGEADRKVMLGAPGHTDWKLLWGATPPQAGGQASFTYPHDGLLAEYGIADSVAQDMRNYTDNWEVWQTYFYGYRAVNNGYEMNRIVRKVCEYAVSHEDWKYSKPQPTPGEDSPSEDGQGSSDSTGGNIDIDNAPASTVCDQGHAYCGTTLNGTISDKTSGYLLSQEDFPSCAGLDSVASGGSLPIPGVHSGGTYAGHNGIDYVAASGTAVHAVQEGYVISMGSYPYTTFSQNQDPALGGTVAGRWMGTYVTVAHNGGYTIYAHLSGLAHIQPGQYVSKGQLLGYVGSTGNSSGPHLHVTWGKVVYLKLAGWIPDQVFFPSYGV